MGGAPTTPASRNLAVFCEKPLALHAAQAQEMLVAAERARVAHFMGLTWRFAPPFATMRREIAAGRIGRVQPMEYPGGLPAPPTAASPSGGILRPTIRHLYEAHMLPRLTGGTPAPGTPAFADGLAAQRVMDTALRSAQDSGWADV